MARNMRARVCALLNVVGNQVRKTYSYSSRRPGISLPVALRTLDAWGYDEILVIDVSRAETLSPTLLEGLRQADIRTPVAYGGGIRDTRDIRRLHQAGVERFVLESLVHDNHDRLKTISDLVGSQALIASLPFHQERNGDLRFAPAGRPSVFPFAEVTGPLVEDGLVSEFLAISVEFKGRSDSFPTGVVEILQQIVPQHWIWAGGIGQKSANLLLSHPATAAIAFGNSLFEHENQWSGFLRSAVK